jgi:5-methylcytosine-specific restriction endonuclease McrA
VRATRFCSTLCKKKAASRRHRERNPGYYKQYSGTPQRRAYAAANRKELARKAREYKRRLKLEQPEAHAAAASASRAWWAANVEKHRLYQSNRRAKKASHPDSVPVSERDWLRLVRRYRGCCAYCEQPATELHMDHVIPLHKGGRHGIGNVLPACPPCNLSKSASLLIEWRMRPDRAAA